MDKKAKLKIFKKWYRDYFLNNIKAEELNNDWDVFLVKNCLKDTDVEMELCELVESTINLIINEYPHTPKYKNGEMNDIKNILPKMRLK